MIDELPEITTERLHLRPLQETDWQAIMYLRTDADINKYVMRAPATNQEEAMQFINRILQPANGGISYYWCITEKGKPDMIGSICLWNFSDDKKSAEVGYDLATRYHGKGYMSEALKALLHFGFTELKLEAIYAYTHTQNSSSIRLLENNNFTYMPDIKNEGFPNNVVYKMEGN